MAKGMYGKPSLGPNGSIKGPKAQTSFVNTPATMVSKKGMKKR